MLNITRSAEPIAYASPAPRVGAVPHGPSLHPSIKLALALDGGEEIAFLPPSPVPSLLYSLGESHESACPSLLCVYFNPGAVRGFVRPQQPAPAQEAPKDTITRIFTGEFSERPSPPPRWFDDGQSYIAMEPAAGGHGRDLVKYDTATGKNREVLITAAQLTPEGAPAGVERSGRVKEPLQIRD